MEALRRILYAEDDERDREMTLNAFEEHNIANRVDMAKDGAEALDYLYRKGDFASRPPGDPVVILLDLKMPRVDGMEVLRQVKRDPDLKMIPIVVLTSSREDQDILNSYSLGVNAYVVKPVDFEQFVRALKDLGLFWAVVNQPPPSGAQ